MNMTTAETITKNDVQSRKHCSVAWMPCLSKDSSSKDSTNYTPISLTSQYTIQSLIKSTANLFLTPYILSQPSAGVEDMQVLKYNTGGEFVLHHDGEPRILTAIYYLNGVGGTWFPLARTSNDAEDDPCLQKLQMDQKVIKDEFLKLRHSHNKQILEMTDNIDDKCEPHQNDSILRPKNKLQTLALGQNFVPGENGLLVKGRGNHYRGEVIAKPDHNRKLEPEQPEINPNIVFIDPGDAIVFYNYCYDEEDRSTNLNWRALHAGLPTNKTDGAKWIANHWFRLNDLIQ